MFVGILGHALFGVVDADQLQHVHRPFPGLFLRDLVIVALQRLHQLVADGVDRVKAGHRVLEDHGDILAPDVAHLLLVVGEQVLPVERDAAAHDFAGFLQQPDDGIGFHGLARTGLAHDAHDFVISQIVADAVYGLDFARGGEEGDLQVLDLEQVLLVFVHCSSLLLLQTRV